MGNDSAKNCSVAAIANKDNSRKSSLATLPMHQPHAAAHFSADTPRTRNTGEAPDAPHPNWDGEALRYGNKITEVTRMSLFRPRVGLVVHIHDVFDRKLRVALGGCQTFVSQQFLNRPQVRAFFQHVRAEGMP